MDMRKIRIQSFKLAQLRLKLLKIKDENIVSFPLQVDEIVNSISGLDKKLKGIVLVKKIIISLSPRFDPKLDAIGEAKDINKKAMDELHESQISYVMIFDNEK